MRSFIYGRYDVLQGARGYEVFDRDRTISRETVKELATLFSSQDPDFRILQVLGSFYVYFPLAGGEWVFGKGAVEERGDFFSYILHGVVLNDEERKALDYNPFFLARLLQPLVGDHRKLPAVSVEAPPQKRRGEQLVAALDACAASEKGNLLFYIAGELATRLARSLSPAEPIYHPYQKYLDAPMWTLVFQLLPAGMRKQVTLATLARFLQKEVAVRGEFDAGKIPAHRQIQLDRPERSDFGQFLFNLSRQEKERVGEGFLVLEAAGRDAEALLTEKLNVERADDRSSWILEYLGNALRAIDKPSVHSLGRWSVVQSYTALFAWKAAFLTAIWARNRTEAEGRFPHLAVDIMATLQRDFRVIAAGAGAAEAARARPHMDRVVEALGATRQRRLLASLLASEELARDYLPSIADGDLVGALFEPDLSEVVFHQSFKHRLQFVPRWSVELNLLFDHPFFHSLGAQTHAAVFDLIPASEPAAYFMDRITAKRFLSHPDEFKQFLAKVAERQRIMSRFINFFRKKAMESPSDTRICDGYWQLLGVCAEVDEAVFKKAVVPWIKNPEIETVAATLVRHPGLFGVLAAAWQEASLDDLSKFRLCFLIRQKCQASGEDYRIHPYVKEYLAGHKFSGLMLEFR